jgi:hypothetical protein
MQDLPVKTAVRGQDRTISARSATKREPEHYGEAMKREYDFSNGKRGPVVPLPKGKTRITIRLDEEVIA